MNKSEIDEQNKKEYENIYQNCLHFISKRLIILKMMDAYMEDSQIISGFIRIFRKIVQMLTTENISMTDKSKDPRVFVREFRKLLVSQNEGLFVFSIRAVFNRYYHYPEIHNNSLIILFQITNYLDTQNLVLTAEKLNLEEFKNHFDPFRSRLRIFCKSLNNLHLNILANISDIAKSKNYTDHEALLKNVMLDLKSYYRNTASAKKRLEDFKTRKISEVEIHEVITRIGLNLTKYHSLSFSLTESYYYDDLVEYLIIIAKNKTNGKDFIEQIAERKRMTIDNVKRFVLAIVENTLGILYNIMNSDDEELSEILADHQIEDEPQLTQLFQECKGILVKHGCSVSKLEKNLIALKDCFES